MDNGAFFERGEGEIDPQRGIGGGQGFCLPFLDDEAVRVVRARLRARAVALGWILLDEPPLDLHAVADGVVIHPDVEGRSVRFVLPASAKDVELISPVSIPWRVSDNCDGRTLGVAIESISIDDGLGEKRRIPVDHPLLCEGFHPVEGDAPGGRWRWTKGRVRLSPELWEGCRSQFFLRVDLAGPAVSRWVAPKIFEPADARHGQPHLRLVATA